MIVPLLIAVFLAQPTAETPNARIERLEDSLIAPCCWQETLKTHRSDVALRMKLEISRRISQGESDRQILEFFKQQYGARVLVEPEGSAWWTAMLAPLLFGVLGLWFVAHLLRKWHAATPAPALGQGREDS